MMVTVSAGEFAATVTKACLGAGVERGVAVELGPACMELALLGRRPIPVLTEELKADQRKRNAGVWGNNGSGWAIPVVASLPEAVSLVDFATIPGAGASSPTVEAPELVVGLALNRMRCQDLDLEISIGAGSWADVVDAVAQLTKNMLPTSLALRVCADKAAMSLPDIVAIDVVVDEWSSLEPWVAKTLVPADELNRADAGAGNTDND